MTENNRTVPFPMKNPQDHADVRTIAERASIELRTVEEEEGILFCCDQRMHVKAGIMGPDYAHCNQCGQTMTNQASPHVNGGILWNEEVMEAHGDRMWTFTPGREEDPSREGKEQRE